MADEAVVENEITLDDFNADEQPPAKAESTPAPEAKAQEKVEDPKGQQEKDTKDDSTVDPKDSVATPPDVPTKAETESPEKAEETKVEETPTEVEKPQTKAEDRKQQLNSEIRDLVAQRNAIRDEVTKQNAETYQPATETELVEGGMTEIEAKVEAMRQERELEKFNTQVADAQLTIASESDRVLRDFPLFNPESEQYDSELAVEASEHLRDMLVIDPNTEQVIGVNGSIYKYYNSLARASGISGVKGQIQGQKNTETMLANADAPTSAAPPKETKDPLMELWKSD